MIRYIPHTPAEVREMLAAIGVGTLDDLFADIPQAARFDGRLDLPGALSEMELVQHLRELSSKNTDTESIHCFLGAGSYRHFIPAVVPYLGMRGEFTTAYTPYQPEVSQGTLQGIFEFQTMICQLTGMEVANASMYDGATGLAEAILMARRITRGSRVLISEAVHPFYRRVFDTYSANLSLDVVTVPVTAAGRTDLSVVREFMDDDVAAVVVQSPNFFGCVEELDPLGDLLSVSKSLLVVAVTELLSLGLLKPPGESGADIVVGEAQAFGNSVSFGGPYVGFFSTHQKFVRQLPGRLAGMTEDDQGRSGFVLTLATREQHIRRERATSNICTNQALCALLAAIHMATLGRGGIRELATQNLQKACYLRARLAGVDGVELLYNTPVFNEFLYRTPRPAHAVVDSMERHGYIAGLEAGCYYPGRAELDRAILTCTTELNPREAMDGYVDALQSVLREELS